MVKRIKYVLMLAMTLLLSTNFIINVNAMVYLGKLTINTEGFTDDTFAIQKIASASISGLDISYVIEDDYINYDCDWLSLNTSQLKEKTKELETVSRNNQNYTATGKTNESGVCVFTGLEPGLYLVYRLEGNKDHSVESFLISVPNIIDGVIKYDVSAKPKVLRGPIEPPTIEPEKPTYRPFIPLTGITRWPFPVLIISGIIFIIVGKYLEKQDEK